MRLSLSCFLTLFCLSIACKSTQPKAESSEVLFFKSQEKLGGDRPASLKLPATYDKSKSYPLVLLLHGRGNSAAITDLYLGLSRTQRQEGYLLLLADGTVRDDGQRVWNATDECCATNNKDVNDSQYLQDLVAEAKAKYNVDPKKIYIFGHSNGGFMAYRLACDTDGVFAGIVSLAGSEFAKAEDCKTKTPITILHVHGTEDPTVPYDAKAGGKAYPGAVEIAERWAQRNQCQTKEVKLLSQNLISEKVAPAGDQELEPSFAESLKNKITPHFTPETDEFLYTACKDNVRVGLWRINGGSHTPLMFGKSYVSKALKFLQAN